jgi:thioredoxin-related protein
MEHHQTTRNLCLIGLTGLLTVHFLMTVAITLPPTPLTAEYGKAIDSWIYPYFSQSWSFFAPTPPTEDDFVIAQYRYRSSTGAIEESSWINLSRTLNEAAQHDRLSSLAIVQATVGNAYCDLLKSEIFKDGKLDEKMLQDLIARNRQPPSLHTLERAAMSCYRITTFKGAPVAVRIGILDHKFPRFTQRYKKDDEEANNSELQFPFVPFESVASFD